ncbi:MAG TPA: SUMF1/EgtB/PvdO family nonheme iron enzyme [Prolixibacteraceae bacterium]|nr:SUMF1/EgtB/PvdO family nonheme iron enzyme [Prolixibacteraceae bacterium]
MRQLSFWFILLMMSLVGCQSQSVQNRSGQTSRTIGWNVNDMEVFGFEDPEYIEQETGPGLVFVQGGTFIMGRIDEDVLGDWDNIPRRVTVASFYMDETEVTNYDYRQYLAWLGSVYPNSNKQELATPDTLVWRSPLAYNEPYVNNYLRHPSYSNYPVVGVSWEQAGEYCKWRTDRVNEYLLIENGFLTLDSTQQGSEVFTTEAYLSGEYEGIPGEKDEQVRWENGLLLPNYRLPTEAEWEYAALGLIGESDGELLTERRMYPWDGPYLRQESQDEKGQMKANYVRGRGDYMGMAGALNDAADITADVFSYSPNDYGLYNMAGNVNEWVSDVYRPLSPVNVEEFQPYRGNVITEYQRNDDGSIIFNEFGQPVVDTIADYRNYLDGDYRTVPIDGSDWTTVQPDEKSQNIETTNSMYMQSENTGVISSRITDYSRVYKGGSWSDRAYWLNPGSRRYLDQRDAKADIGFRCAMTRLGPPKVAKN